MREDVDGTYKGRVCQTARTIREEQELQDLQDSQDRKSDDGAGGGRKISP